MRYSLYDEEKFKNILVKFKIFQKKLMDGTFGVNIIITSTKIKCFAISFSYVIVRIKIYNFYLDSFFSKNGWIYEETVF